MISRNIEYQELIKGYCILLGTSLNVYESFFTKCSHTLSSIKTGLYKICTTSYTVHVGKWVKLNLIYEG